MIIRNVRPTGYPPIISVLDKWWGERKMSDMLPRLFFEHFCETSFILEEDNQIAAFLIGFFSQSRPEEAYIHFVGVHPQYRKRGFGRELYEHFFIVMHQHQHRVVRCVTSPINTGSIAFHTRMGFQIVPQDTQKDGIPYCADYDGLGEHRVLFVKQVG
ncbi:MAG: GNAT family N-acetyltransferase [Anaerolineales bacterium]|nr:GNAT family N-acetyltransferase [Anaerolineales bacterium]